MKVVIIDDDPLVCRSLEIIIGASPDIQVAATGGDGNEALSLYEQHDADILLMDIRMKNMNGIEAAKVVLSRHKEALILFLTTFLDDEYIIQALNVGAKGYILKQDFASIIPALKSVMSGQSVFGGDIVSKLPSMLSKSGTFNYSAYKINEKELKIIELVSQGLSNKEIAENLYLSEGTVRNYLSSILEKLELRDRTQLAVFYYQNKN